MARDAGAKKVYFASAAPPVRFPNVYGIDIPTTTELIAHNRSEDEVEKVMGADRVVYNDLQDVVDAIAQLNPKLLSESTSCFSVFM
jgi:amidophosphoribosyltransferase